MTEKDIYQDSSAYLRGRRDGRDEVMSQMSEIIGKCYNTGYKDAMDFAIKYLLRELVVAQDEFGSDRIMTDYGTKEEFIKDFCNDMIKKLMQRNIKVGDRIYFECPLTGTIHSRVVIDITPDNGTDYYGNPILFNWLKTGPHEGIEDYNTLAPSNPKVKAYIKELKAKREALINEALMFAYPDRKGFSKDERKACDRLLDFAYTKMKELEEYE